MGRLKTPKRVRFGPADDAALILRLNGVNAEVTVNPQAFTSPFERGRVLVNLADAVAREGALGTLGTLGNPIRLTVPGGPKAREALEGANPALVVFKKPAGGIVVVVDSTAYDEPEAWGCLLVDAIGHIANAYAQSDGADPAKVAARIGGALLAELFDGPPPTTNAVPIREEGTP